MKQIIIIGNGIAGITAAREIRKGGDHAITVISSETDHFFSRTALMYIYMGHMRYEHTKPYEDWFWKKNRIELMRARVSKVDSDNKLLHTDDGRELDYDALIIASGSRSNKFGWPGQDLDGVQGLYHLQDLESMERFTKGIDRAVIVGGGLIGVEMAEMLHTRDIPVTFLVREKAWMGHIFPAEESAMIQRQMARNHIDLRLATELDRVEGDAQGRVRAVVTKDGEEIPCQFLGLTVGVSPNIAFLEGSGIETQKGVLVDEQLRTSLADVYAIGDCAQVREPRPGRRPVEPLWYTGRIMGQTVARTICDEATAYDPGIWFNSAKFFDLEWQVYGEVPSTLPEGTETLYWQDAARDVAIRINYRADDHVVTGFNVMGIRYRHELCHEWLRDERPLDFVLQNLGAANFDPEFYKQYEAEIIATYNKRFPDKALSLKRRRGLRSLFGARAATRASG
jgi:NAD(P)H-nitrite reductase large subunit